MQIRLYRLCHIGYGILYLTDALLDAVYDSVNNVCSPLDRRLCKSRDKGNGCSKSRFYRCNNISYGCLYAGPHRSKGTGNRCLYSIYHRGHDCLYRIPCCRNKSLNCCHNRGYHGLNCIPHGCHHKFDCIKYCRDHCFVDGKIGHNHCLYHFKHRGEHKFYAVPYGCKK